jgi:hypothetical protein
VLADRFVHELRELAGGEAAHDGNDPVVPADAMKSHWEGGQPEARGGNGAATEIADDHALARDAIELLQHAHGIGALEVMEQLGAEHDIDAVVGDGQRQRVAADSVVDCPSTGRRERGRGVETDRRHRPGGRRYA